MVDPKGLVFRIVIPFSAIAGGLYLSNSVVVSAIGLLIVYGLWLGILKGLVSRSRFVGGLVMLVLSVPLFVIGIIGSWVGLFGLLVFAHGNWLSMTGAARLDV